MKRTSALFFLFLIILSFALPLDAHEPATVLKVVDGDTLRVRYKSDDIKVRLIGIDCPESSPNQRAKRESQRTGQNLETITSMGKQATEFVMTLVKPDDKVTIEFDVEKKDKYKRLLGYVYLSNVKMLNEEIVKAGYANLLTYPPNVKHQERFLKAYREARENKRGLWK